jgi:DNA-directed RNA polymerase specialized sigma24 family protein
MPKSKSSDRTLDLREFIKENDQRVFDFCSYLLASDFEVEELVLSTFRSFGEYFRREAESGSGELPASALRIRLFQIAWLHVQNAMEQSFFPQVGGRDTRLLKGLDTDVLPSRAESREKVAAKPENRVGDRLARVDVELRAPVVLRDILKFEDEEAAKILSLRWGVYRHRLHRGRMDFKDALRGIPTGQPTLKGASAHS